jgi:hypothetical protein
LGKKNTIVLLLLLAAGVGLDRASRADEWDLGGDSDVGPATDNVLFHGSVQVHDLLSQGVNSDQDWFKVKSRPFSSYEVVIDGLTGDLDLTTADVQRFAGNGTDLLQTAVVSDDGGVLSLDWSLGAPDPALSARGTSLQADDPRLNFVRVAGPACGTGCQAEDRYRVRFFETTYTIPRFNNTGTQATTLLIQNSSDRVCIAGCYYFDANGAPLDITTFLGLEPGELKVVPPGSLPQGQSGSVRVAHTCGYGGLSGKAVSVEATTGFTFDTPLVLRPW